MRIVDLESLIWIHRLGSFTAAAERLHITQSAITRRINQLELDLGVRLFERNRKQVALTQAGRTALGHAERIVTQAARMRREVGTLEKLQGTVRLGAGEVFSAWWLSGFIVHVARVYPGVTLEIDIDISERHIARFEQNELDMLLLPGEPPSRGEQLLIDHIPYLWMASPRLNIPDRPIGPEELSKWPLFTLSRESQNYRLLVQWFRDAGIRPGRIDLCNNLAVLVELIASGMGVAILPAPLFRKQLDSGQIKAVKTTPSLPMVPLWAAYHEGNTLPLATLANTARECHNLAKEFRLPKDVI